VDVDLIGWVGVGLGGAYGCRCGILYAPMLGVVFYVALVSLTSSSYPSPCSPYSSELIGGVLFWSAVPFYRQYHICRQKYRVYQNNWSGFEVHYIHKCGEQNYKY